MINGARDLRLTIIPKVRCVTGGEDRRRANFSTIHFQFAPLFPRRDAFHGTLSTRNPLPLCGVSRVRGRFANFCERRGETRLTFRGLLRSVRKENIGKSCRETRSARHSRAQIDDGCFSLTRKIRSGVARYGDCSSDDENYFRSRLRNSRRNRRHSFLRANFLSARIPFKRR